MRWLWAVLFLVVIGFAGWWIGSSTPGVVVDAPAASSVAQPPPAVPSVSPSPGARVLTPPRKDAPSHVLVRAGWGGGPGQLGKKNDPEASPDGPMSLAVDGRGTLYVLDGVNRRVQKWSNRGTPLGAVSIGGDTAQDLALGKHGELALLDRLGEKNLQVFDANGAPLGDVNLVGKGIPEAGGTTGLFTDRDGNFWVERGHTELVRVAFANGHSDPERATAPGRPSRDGRQWLSGAIADRAAGTALVRGLGDDGQARWQALVLLGAPILYLSLLDSDGAGNVYLAGHTGSESAQPPYSITDEQLVIVGLGPEGTPRGLLALPAARPAAESYRELAIGDDGTIYRMVLGPAGVTVESYRF
jgi:hypothetical protein